jgi:class 3 adenylate cyclase
MQTKILAIMFTDIKGFTSLTSTISRKEIEQLLLVHDKILRPIFLEFRGTIIKTIGDAFMVTFESPTDAILCGMKIQEVILQRNKKAPGNERFEIRVAVNSGEVYVQNKDVYGEPVNIAARIEGIAEANQVYFTEAVYLAMNKNEIPSCEAGVHHLKGIPEPVKIYKILREKNSLHKVINKRKNLLNTEPSLSNNIKGSMAKFFRIAFFSFIFTLIVLTTVVLNEQSYLKQPYMSKFLYAIGNHFFDTIHTYTVSAFTR